MKSVLSALKDLIANQQKLQHTCLAKHKNSCLDVQTKWFKENMFRIENVTKPFTYILINIFLWHDWQTNGPSKFYTGCSLVENIRDYKKHLYILNRHRENYYSRKTCQTDRWTGGYFKLYSSFATNNMYIHLTKCQIGIFIHFNHQS